MKKNLKVARTLAGLRRTIASWRARGKTVALVPTMGALHAGHLALVETARRRADRVVVSIFVNPAQFAPHEDFAKYPRTFATDRRKLSDAGVDLIWAPAAQLMYPSGFSTKILPEGPALADLEDAYRPHFFGGVATVVTKLFLQCQPNFAIFGQKDYQQLKVVTKLARDLDLPLKVVGVSTKREKDGLALSSRNVYLSEDERAMAPTMYRALRECAATIAHRGDIATAIAQARMEITQAGFSIDYVEARNAETLAPVRTRKDGPIRLLAAARLGRTRLIDNVAV
ncbi:MAG: pantoate--beta-alanine ligase [Xanthobacteraceae bacterium]